MWQDHRGALVPGDREVGGPREAFDGGRVWTALEPQGQLGWDAAQAKGLVSQA